MTSYPRIRLAVANTKCPVLLASRHPQLRQELGQGLEGAKCRPGPQRHQVCRCLQKGPDLLAGNGARPAALGPDHHRAAASQGAALGAHGGWGNNHGVSVHVYEHNALRVWLQTPGTAQT